MSAGMWIDGKGWLSLDGMVDSRASNLWMESTSVSFEKARYSNREVVPSCGLYRRPYGCVILDLSKMPGIAMKAAFVFVLLGGAKIADRRRGEGD